VCDPNDPNGMPFSTPQSLGHYANNFVYLSEDQALEELFCRLLSNRCKVDFMDLFSGFLGSIFLGVSLVLWLWCIQTNLVLLQT
jgi:hypothetical protein